MKAMNREEREAWLAQHGPALETAADIRNAEMAYYESQQRKEGALRERRRRDKRAKDRAVPTGPYCHLASERQIEEAIEEARCTPSA